MVPVKRLAILVLLLPLAAQAAIVRVGHTFAGSTDGLGTSITVAYAPTSTNTVFVLGSVYRNDSVNRPTAPLVGDGGHNTYTLITATLGANPQFDGSKSTTYLFVSRNVTGGSYTYTFSFSTEPAFRNIFVVEYSGLSITPDGYNSNTSTGATLTSGSITTTNVSDLLIGAFSTSDTGAAIVYAGTGGWAVIDQTNNSTQAAAAIMEQIVSSTGTYAATATLTGATAAYAGAIAATKAATVSSRVSVTIQ